MTDRPTDEGIGDWRALMESSVLAALVATPLYVDIFSDGAFAPAKLRLLLALTVPVLVGLVVKEVMR